ncbi:MAG: hydantoinase B/oxoprolinase family protein [Thermoleophilia bacterium]
MSSAAPARPIADPALAAIVANRLHAIAEHMAESMLRTSRSPVFQMRDFVTGVFTADGRWVATKDWIPVLAGSMPSALDAVRERFDGDVHEGDVYVLNDPYRGNNHPPDITIVKPVFHAGELAFWAMSKGHHADVGGGGVMGYNPNAVDCWDDALRIPPVRLQHRGEPVRDVWEMILLNVRMRAFVEGDLHCQIGAVTVGEADLLAMIETFGREALDAAIDCHLEASERHMRAELSAFRDGVYRAERLIENGSAVAPDPVRVVVEARVEGDAVTFDFTGSDPQVAGYANSPRPNTIASCHVAVFALVDPDLGMNTGSTAPIAVITEPGTVVHALEPAATTLATLAGCEAIVEAIWIALADAVPRGSNAGWARACNVAQAGIEEGTGRPFITIGAFGHGGSGATLGADGWDGLGTPVTMGGHQTMDPEQVELSGPVTVLGFGLDTDSAGAGRWRGGLAAWVRYRVEQDDLPCLRWGGGTADETAPFGLHGGHAGRPNRAELHRADGAVEPIVVNTIRTVGAGDIVVMRHAGGGGYGDPAERDPGAVLRDVRAGVVTPAAAERDYRVTVDTATWTVDAARTAALRAADLPSI